MKSLLMAVLAVAVALSLSAPTFSGEDKKEEKKGGHADTFSGDKKDEHKGGH